MKITSKVLERSFPSNMKKLSGGLILVFLFVLLLLRYGMVENPLAEISLPSPFSRNSSQHLQWLSAGVDELVVLNPKNESEIISTGSLMSHLSIPQNLSVEELLSLHTWKHMVYLVNFSKGLPQAVEAVKEAVTAWEGLMASIEDERLARYGNGSKSKRLKEKQCPYSVIRMNSSEFSDGDFRLKIPCGLVQGSSLTVIGNPEGILGNFKIELVGTTLPGEQDPPIILHFNVRLHGDKITENPVIVQNAWTLANDWGPEERCPSPDPDNNNKKVDDLDQCSKVVGEGDEQLFTSKLSSYTSTRNLTKGEGTKPRRYFPFKQGYLAISTLRVGTEGIQTSVNGKHITSFAFREALEPWLVNEARVLGDIKLLSVLASGLPTSEDSEHVTDLKLLKSAPLPIHKAVDLFVGVFSTANNFKQRMAVRRTWMQYPAVRSQVVAVRFFVGLHKNQLVNEELWNEARTYGDIQLMPFVDYYSLITLKTVAICIYGTNIVSAKYVMKTDDDAFVRIDEVLSSLNRTNVMHGLLYGRISNDDLPNRNPDSKWYISPEEWPGQRYPPWAHGPGYVVSKDIAKEVYKRHKNGHLKMFKLEDVAMGIWTDDMKKAGMHVEYVNDDRIYIGGCEEGYLVAHYQQPREMLCLWQKLQETNHAKCCGE